LKELINTVKHIKSPSMTLYLAGGSRDEAKMVADGIVEVTLREVAESSCVVDDPIPCGSDTSPDHGWAPAEYALATLLRPEQVANATSSVLRVQLSRSALQQRSMKVSNVTSALQSALGDDMLCIGSDDNDDQLVMHLRVKRSQEEGVVSDRYFLRFLDANIMDGVLLRGAAGVRKAYVETRPVVTFDQETGEAVNTTEAFVETEGINLLDAFLLDGVDPTRVTCNDPSEMLAALGVEAARAVLLREIRNVIQFDGGHVSYRHLSLLADVMTNKGQIMSITRHGINRTEAGPLMKCTFEETCDILFSAAADCEGDNLSGVAESVMLGTMAPMGTGVFDLLLDERAVGGRAAEDGENDNEL